MTTEQLSVAGAVLLPLAGAFLVYGLGYLSEKLRDAVSVILVSVGFVVVLLGLLSAVNAGEVVTASFAGQTWLLADGLAVFMSLVTYSVGLIIVIYSVDYVKHYEHRNEYFMMVLLFLGSMMGLVFSSHLVALYGFWELTGFASWRLIGFYRDPLAVRRADKAFLVTVFGALVMLTGIIVVYFQTGSFEYGTAEGRTISSLAVFLILVGILAKSATLPLHTWLPDAGVAPAPVTALLHAAVLVKIGVYVYARLFVVSWEIDPVWHIAIPWLAALSAVVAGGAAFIETDIKRIIAYSTVSQLAFIFLGLAVDTRMGVAGALLFILMHGIAKGGLFLCAGIVEQKTHCKDITQLGGLSRSMPLTTVAFLLCAFSVMGIPPFGGFFSKYLVIAGAVQSGQSLLAGVFTLAGAITLLYLLRLFSLVFMGEFKGAGRAIEAPPAEGSWLMVSCVLLLGALSLGSGVLISWPASMVDTVVSRYVALR